MKKFLPTLLPFLLFSFALSQELIKYSTSTVSIFLLQKDWNPIISDEKMPLNPFQTNMSSSFYYNESNDNVIMSFQTKRNNSGYRFHIDRPNRAIIIDNINKYVEWKEKAEKMDMTLNKIIDNSVYVDIIGYGEYSFFKRSNAKLTTMIYFHEEHQLMFETTLRPGFLPDNLYFDSIQVDDLQKALSPNLIDSLIKAFK